MRLSSLTVTAVLLFSSVVFAQHSQSSTPSAPASPPPSAPPSTSSSAGASAASFHSSAPSSPPPSGSSSPVSNSSSMSHSSSASSAPASALPSHSAAPPARSAGEEIKPEPRLAGTDGKIVPAPRIGEVPDKEKEPKPLESDLRKPVCKDGPCKEPPAKPVAPSESDLRRRICIEGPCPCPPGEMRSKNGACVAGTPTGYPECQPGQYWNGGCTAIPVCQQNEYWNGVSCVVSAAECASISARAAAVISEVRGIRGQMQGACASGPSGQECSDLTQRHDAALQRYRMLMSEAPLNCRMGLPDPSSL
jgi:hypothetical protein